MDNELIWSPIIDMGKHFTTELTGSVMKHPEGRTDIPRYQDLPWETRHYLETEYMNFIND